ncbi:MAG: DUF1569 domain-containing protein [Phycisphaerales bacterium]|nr:DUF1569 domain-containing protein [Phycisphaerales bacterium]
MAVADKSKWSPKSFHSIEELSADLDQMQAAYESGTLSTDGGWTVGQNLMHCGVLIKNSYDGFEMNAPAIVRMLCSVLLKPIATKPTSQMKPGFKLPKKAKELVPEESVSFEEGMEMMRTQVGRIQSGERITRPSPLLGKMTHEQWVNLHLNHCRMHFGYLNY